MCWGSPQALHMRFAPTKTPEQQDGLLVLPFNLFLRCVQIALVNCH
jgi:hypothetical protein